MRSSFSVLSSLSERCVYQEKKISKMNIITFFFVENVFTIHRLPLARQEICYAKGIQTTLNTLRRNFQDDGR